MLPPIDKALRGVSPAFFLLASLDLSGMVAASEIDVRRQQELVRLVRHDCGSCHGLTLKGGLGPALLPDTLRDKDEVALSETILRGRNGTAMPPWSAFLNEQEARWVVQQLIRGFPDAQ